MEVRTQSWISVNYISKMHYPAYCKIPWQCGSKKLLLPKQPLPSWKRRLSRWPQQTSMSAEGFWSYLKTNVEGISSAFLTLPIVVATDAPPNYHCLLTWAVRIDGGREEEPIAVLPSPYWRRRRRRWHSESTYNREPWHFLLFQLTYYPSHTIRVDIVQM